MPFDVNIGGKRVGISFESLVWFFIVTAGATVVGELVYDKWVSPYLNDLPSLPGAATTINGMGRMVTRREKRIRP